MMPASDKKESITIATLLGDWPMQHEWVPVCINSWINIQGVKWPVLAVSDNQLDLCQTKLDSLACSVPLLAVENQESTIQLALSNYPSLQQIRSKDLTWRKIVDTVIATREQSSRVLLIDTDVLVRRKVVMPDMPGIYYLREDIPAYRGRAMFPLSERIVKSFNAGFVLFDPSEVDLNELERLARLYFLNLENYWWTEQACWAAIAGSSKYRFYFDGRSACVLSGFKTRTPLDVQSNCVHLLSSKKRASAAYLSLQAGDATVIHMSGLSKKHWEVFHNSSIEVNRSAPPVVLKAIKDDNLSIPWRLAIALRLLLLEFIDSSKKLLQKVSLRRRAIWLQQ